jgi:preprotein translocase subunit SecE
MARMKDLQQFVEDVQTEMKRVTWPDREQLRNATAVILVFCVIIAIIIGLMDTTFSWFVRTFVGVLSG